MTCFRPFLCIMLALAALSLALFLAIGKRRAELTLLEGYHGVVPRDTREALSHYSEKLLDTYTAMFANSTWLTYAFFAFLQPTVQVRRAVLTFLGGFELPFTEAKYLMATVPVVIYAVMRYLYIIYEKKEGESPERVLLTDKPLLVAVIIWLVMTIGIIYYLGT